MVYVSDFHPRILYLTGTQDQLAKVTKAYRVYFSKVGHACIHNPFDGWSACHSEVWILTCRWRVLMGPQANEEDEEHYLVDHSIVLYLVCRDHHIQLHWWAMHLHLRASYSGSSVQLSSPVAPLHIGRAEYGATCEAI